MVTVLSSTAELPAGVLERAVVGGEIDVARAGRLHGRGVSVDEAMFDLRVPQADGEVATTFAGGDHQPALQTLERHVPQPRRIATVLDPGVDADDDRHRRGPDEVQRFGPSGRVLG